MKKIRATRKNKYYKRIRNINCHMLMQKKKSNKVWSDLYELFLIYLFIKRFILAASVLRTLHVYLHSNLHTCYFFWTGSAHVCPVRKCDAFVSGEGGVDLCFSGVWKHDWACGPPTGGAGRSRPTLCADTAAGFLHRVMITCDVVFPRSELFWFGVKFWLFTIRGNEPRTFMSFSFCFCDLLVFIFFHFQRHKFTWRLSLRCVLCI